MALPLVLSPHHPVVLLTQPCECSSRIREHGLPRSGGAVGSARAAEGIAAQPGPAHGAGEPSTRDRGSEHRLGEWRYHSSDRPDASRLQRQSPRLSLVLLG